MMSAVRGMLVVGIALAVALAAAAQTGSTTYPPQVTIIGDSVSTAITRYDDLTTAVGSGLRVDWEVAICRRVAGLSCPFQGTRPATLVDLVPTLPAVAPLVVVELGYNDPEGVFAAEVDQAMRMLLARGAQHVIWLTMHSAIPPYAELDDILRQAQTRWPQLELLDWDAASADHPSWFQEDAIHLDKRGGRALAALIRAAITQYVAPLRIARPAIRRQPFTAELRADGGVAPYTWRLADGALPRGVHLLANGRLYGRPESLRARVEVEDAEGTIAMGRVAISPARAASSR
jgi:hypothetical protein